MSTSFMAGVAASQAAVAQQAAHQARVSQCKMVVPNFNAQTATVAEMKEYAGCVDTLYPSEVGSSEVIVFKILFVSALLGMVYFGWKERDDFAGMCLSGFCGFFAVPIILAFLGAIAVGLHWLVS